MKKREVAVKKRAAVKARKGRPSAAAGAGDYRGVLDAAADMIFLREPQSGRIVDANAAAARQLGYAREQLLGMSYFDILPSDAERERARQAFGQAQEAGSSSRPTLLRRKDGSLLEADIRNTPATFGGAPVIVGIARDLTAQRALERRARAFYEAFRGSNDTMFYADRNAVILDVNEAFTRRFGYTREEAVGRTPRLVRSRHSTPELYRRLWSDILDPEKGFWRGRIINRTKSGEEIPIILSITAVRDAKGETLGFVSSGVDISEQEELHRRLAKSEALAAVGSMAAVMAHEIRNPLGSIVSAATSLARETLPPDDRTLLLNVLRKESQRLNETLHQFLQFARPREPKRELQDLNALVREVLRMVRSDAKVLGETALEERLDASLAAFPFDGDLVRQVLWNIILNGLQAMEKRGRLTVTTVAGAEEAAIHIDDTGAGIAPESLRKIFQPFHTTKNQGTGLGLAVAERIIHAHGGRILVESEPGRGARFSVILPVKPPSAP